LIERAFAGEAAPWVFAFKLLFTVITLGGGFVGGEVTPLFVIGATLGHALGHVLGIDPAWLAMLGFIAVFAGASNTPLACVLMGFELFGGGSIVYMALICALAYVASGRRSIYAGQEMRKPGWQTEFQIPNARFRQGSGEPDP
jgi:H+/Cl- antiporter ClcA